MAKPQRKRSQRKKVVVTATDKRMIAKARRELAAGKGTTLGELLVEMLKRDARKHAA